MPTVEGLTAERIQELLDLKADLALLDGYATSTDLTDGLATKPTLVSGRVAYSQLPTDVVQDSDLTSKADLVSGRVAYAQLPTDIGTDGDITAATSGLAVASTVNTALGLRPLKTDLDMDASNNVQLAGHFAGMSIPAEQGFAAWTFPPESIQGAKLPTNGVVYLSMFYIAKSVTITKIGWGINVAGASPVSSQNKLGIYNSSGVLLCDVDVTSRVATVGSFMETVSATVLAPGRYWIAFLFNASTCPQIMRGSDVSAQMSNLNRTASDYRFAIAATSRTSLMGSYSVAANANIITSFWGAVAQ